MKCEQVSDEPDARFAYVIADMADIDAYEHVVQVCGRVCDIDSLCSIGVHNTSASHNTAAQ